MAAAGAGLWLGALLAGCSTDQSPHDPPSTIGGDVVAPITMAANDLQSAQVDLVVGQVLNITTGDLDADSYAGVVSDSSIAAFEPGGEKGGATTNPGVHAKSEGRADVTLTNADAGIQPINFEVTVSVRP